MDTQKLPEASKQDQANRPGHIATQAQPGLANQRLLAGPVLAAVGYSGLGLLSTALVVTVLIWTALQPRRLATDQEQP